MPDRSVVRSPLLVLVLSLPPSLEDVTNQIDPLVFQNELPRPRFRWKLHPHDNLTPITSRILVPST